LVAKYSNKYGLNKCLKIIQLNKHTYYDNCNKKICSLREKYSEIEKAIREIIRENPWYGYRRILKELRKRKKNINHKALKKLLKESGLGLLRKIRHKRKSGIEKILDKLGDRVNLVKRLTEIKLFQVFFTDFTEIIYDYGHRKIWLIVYLENISKKVLGYNIGNETTVVALKAYRKAVKFLKSMRVKLEKVILHQDQGTQFKSYEYIKQVVRDGITVSFSRKGHPEDNPEMESFYGRFKDEWKDEIYEATTLAEVKEIIRKGIRYYNTKRIHSVLGQYSPDEFIRMRKKLKIKRLS